MSEYIITREQTDEIRVFEKRCYTCDALGYKDKNDFKRKRRYCFKRYKYISDPSSLVCREWIPTD